MIVQGVTAWLLGSLLIGFFGRRYRFGFWGYFFVSVLLTPILGLLLLIAAIPTKRARKVAREADRRNAAAAKTRRAS